MSSYSAYNSKDHRFVNLTEDEYNSFINLSSNKDIVIQKADKGNSVVIIKKTEYIRSMELLLSDTTKFRKVQINPKHKVNKELRHLLDMEETIIDTLKELVADCYLSEEDYKFLKPTGRTPGIMYGLCKIHKPKKDDLPPFRPILSAIGTATYNLAKFLVKILTDVCYSKYCLKDLFSFAKEIQAQDSTLYMSSMDVDSLFTNIPLKETIAICSSRLFFKKRKVGGLLKRHFEELLLLATTQSCFIFNETYYKQIDGVAMWSPLGPSLANIFMSHHEENWIAKCPTQFKPIYYRRYVDDIIVLFKDRLNLPTFQKYMNSRHKNIKFTIEEEVDNSLPFLDILVTRKDGVFTTSLYRKVTFSGVYSNYKSHIAKSYKLGLVLTLIHRAYTICSSYANLHLELESIKDILLIMDTHYSVLTGVLRSFCQKFFPNNNQGLKLKRKNELLSLYHF